MFAGYPYSRPSNHRPTGSEAERPGAVCARIDRFASDRLLIRCGIGSAAETQ